MMLHVVSFSSGLSSALAVDRVIGRYGECEIVFMDTQIEDEDNYRFMDDCQRRWGKSITVLREGRTPYKVGTDEHIIPNQKVGVCTFRLKIDPFKQYLEELDRENEITVHIGYDFTEMHRCEATRTNYEKHGYHVDFPLLWKPYEFKKYSEVCLSWGIEPPRMYNMGYTHANCGGRCLKQGQGDWLRTLINFPERYAEAEMWEKEMRNKAETARYAILRDQRDGKVRPKTLEELRIEFQKKQHVMIDLFEYDRQSSCLNCNVGMLVDSKR